MRWTNSRGVISAARWRARKFELSRRTSKRERAPEYTAEISLSIWAATTWLSVSALSSALSFPVPESTLYRVIGEIPYKLSMRGSPSTSARSRRSSRRRATSSSPRRTPR